VDVEVALSVLFNVALGRSGGTLAVGPKLQGTFRIDQVKAQSADGKYSSTTTVDEDRCNGLVLLEGAGMAESTD
jgi:hypothetical protein